MKNTTINHTLYYLHVMLQLFKRDIYVFRSHWKKFFINYAILAPLVTIVGPGYLFAHISMNNPSPLVVTNYLTGYCLWPIFLIAYSLNMPLLFDLHEDRFVEYQATTIKPSLLIIEKILFSTLISFVYIIPLYPMMKFILGASFVTSTTSWPMVMVMLFLGALFSSCYALFFVCFVKRIEQVGNYFIRINFPLLMLGGSIIQWSVIHKYSWALGASAQANPFLYITEGVRQAITGGSDYFSFSLSISALIIFSVLFGYLAMRSFKKKTDCI